MAMIGTAESDFADLGGVASHIVLPNCDGLAGEGKEMERLISDLPSHPPAELINVPEASKLLFWPFRLAKQIAPFRDQPQRLLTILQSLTSLKSIDDYLGVTKTAA